MGNAHSQKQWLTGEVACVQSDSKAVRIPTHISWSCLISSAQRQTAVIENTGISIHMWGEEWDKRSVAGAAEEKESAQQLEVAVKQKKF